MRIKAALPVTTVAGKSKIGISPGAMSPASAYSGHRVHEAAAIRMNLALPLTRVQEAFERLDKYVFNGEWV